MYHNPIYRKQKDSYNLWSVFLPPFDSIFPLSRPYLEQPVVVYHPLLVLQQTQQGVLRVQQHLALFTVLALSPRLFQGQDLQNTVKLKSNIQYHFIFMMT